MAGGKTPHRGPKQGRAAAASAWAPLPSDGTKSPQRAERWQTAAGARSPAPRPSPQSRSRSGQPGAAREAGAEKEEPSASTELAAEWFPEPEHPSLGNLKEHQRPRDARAGMTNPPATPQVQADLAAYLGASGVPSHKEAKRDALRKPPEPGAPTGPPRRAPSPSPDSLPPPPPGSGEATALRADSRTLQRRTMKRVLSTGGLASSAGFSHRDIEVGSNYPSLSWPSRSASSHAPNEDCDTGRHWGLPAKMAAPLVPSDVELSRWSRELQMQSRIRGVELERRDPAEYVYQKRPSPTLSQKIHQRSLRNLKSLGSTMSQLSLDSPPVKFESQAYATTGSMFRRKRPGTQPSASSPEGWGGAELGGGLGGQASRERLLELAESLREGASPTRLEALARKTGTSMLTGSTLQYASGDPVTRCTATR